MIVLGLTNLPISQLTAQFILARLHSSAEELLLNPQRLRQRPCWRQRLRRRPRQNVRANVKVSEF